MVRISVTSAAMASIKAASRPNLTMTPLRLRRLIWGEVANRSVVSPPYILRGGHYSYTSRNRATNRRLKMLSVKVMTNSARPIAKMEL